MLVGNGRNQVTKLRHSTRFPIYLRLFCVYCWVKLACGRCACQKTPIEVEKGKCISLAGAAWVYTTAFPSFTGRNVPIYAWSTQLTTVGPGKTHIAYKLISCASLWAEAVNRGGIIRWRNWQDKLMACTYLLFKFWITKYVFYSYLSTVWTAIHEVEALNLWHEKESSSYAS